MSIDIFSNDTLQELTDCLFQFIQTTLVILKSIKPECIIYQKLLSRIITLLSIIKNNHEQAIVFDMKRYEKIKRLTMIQSEDYTTGCLLNYKYIKNRYRPTAINSTILVIIFWNFTMFQYRSDSPQVKGNLIPSRANMVYELPPELPNDLRNQEILKKSQIWVDNSLVSSLPLRTQTVFLQELRLCQSQLKKITKKYQIFLFLSSFTGLLYFVSNILSRIVVIKKNQRLIQKQFSKQNLLDN